MTITVGKIVVRSCMTKRAVSGDKLGSLGRGVDNLGFRHPRLYLMGVMLLSTNLPTLGIGYSQDSTALTPSRPPYFS
jgi:hypothetical protein